VYVPESILNEIVGSYKHMNMPYEEMAFVKNGNEKQKRKRRGVQEWGGKIRIMCTTL
jgi:hypothetical protein